MGLCALVGTVRLLLHETFFQDLGDEDELPSALIAK